MEVQTLTSAVPAVRLGLAAALGSPALVSTNLRARPGYPAFHSRRALR
jgi:hypothetical protein